MKAIAVTPKTPNSARVIEVPEPKVGDVPNGRGVRVKVLRVGLDGTDREINDGLYGAAPPGFDYLVLGHESFGVVEEVGPAVHEFAPGDHVVALVRHPGHSLYDTIGRPDLTTEATYHEHGINLLHGFLTESYVDEPEYLVKVPQGLKEVGVLLEPASVAEKGINQAYEIQRRLKVWQPKCAAVLGAGPLGLLATLFLRLRRLEVVTFARQEAPYLNSELVEALGATYVSTNQRSLSQVAMEGPPFDLIFEATGYSPLVFEAMGVLAKNGVLVLSSVTGGKRMVEVPADALNLSFVLGNKVMVGTVNAAREDFEAGVRDLSMAEAEYPGWLRRLLTRKVEGLGTCPKEIKLLEFGPGNIKTFVELAPLQ
ncbi:MAG: glucose 1-dehydrogenase [Myxococcaceae bacterium]|nr:glucose 1-dehydrogenase [Myxococcaceae bacterium]MCI0673056.1 glucose 1-dehydrogenase [Myxococcaceae bacterium]